MRTYFISCLLYFVFSIKNANSSLGKFAFLFDFSDFLFPLDDGMMLLEVKRERHFSQTWLLSESIQKELKGTVVFPMLFVRALLSRFRVLSTLIQRQPNVRNSPNSADFDKMHPFDMHHIFGFCHQPSVLICKDGSGLVWVWAEFGLWIDRL